MSDDGEQRKDDRPPSLVGLLPPATMPLASS